MRLLCLSALFAACAALTASDASVPGCDQVAITAPLAGGKTTTAFIASGTYTGLACNQSIEVTLYDDCNNVVDGPYTVILAGGMWAQSLAGPAGTGYSVEARVVNGTSTDIATSITLVAPKE
jgi:hypothetical protein